MTLAIAHRGDTVQHWENTMPAIRSALAGGAGMILVDLKLTADGYVVLSHDDTLDRIWGLPYPITHMQLAELPAFGVGGDYRIPTLMEALAETVYAGSIPLMLAVSSVEVALAAESVVNEHKLAGHVLYTGTVETMRALREQRPGAELALTWDEPTLPPAEIWEALRPRLYNCHYKLLTHELVTDVHQRGAAISAWTVNEFSEMARLMGMGLDAILTENTSDLVALTGSSHQVGSYQELSDTDDHETR